MTVFARLRRPLDFARPRCSRSANVAAVCAVALGLAPEAAWGAETAVGSGSGLHTIDWMILAVYAVMMLSIGWWYSRKQETSDEYFLGGGAMKPWLIGVSLFATLLSTITYLAVPGEVCGKGPMEMTRLLALPVVFLVVSLLLIPALMRQRVTSAYELLELRLGLGARLMGAAMFVALRLVWMTLLVYKTAEALAVMMGVGPEWITWIVLATGSIAVAYTTMGGLRAVVITDFVQTVMLFGGALLVLLLVTVDYGGLGWFPTQWQPHWDRQPIASWDPGTRVTLVGSTLAMTVWFIATLAGDQVSVQRFMATRDVGAARRALGIQLSVTFIVNMVLTLVGLALMSYFVTHADRLPENMSVRTNADQVFPLFIAHQLPIGVSGLVLAGLFAAAMSSIDSGVNSITAVVMSDFLQRFGKAPVSPRGRVWFARGLALVIGAVIVWGSTKIGAVPGNIYSVTQKTSNLLTVPIFTLFFFALFCPGIAPRRAVLATTAGLLTAAVIAFSGPLAGWLAASFGVDPAVWGSAYVAHSVADPTTGFRPVVDPISFQWIGPAALVVALTLGLFPITSIFRGPVERDPH